jgi:hypothetical protein
MQPIPALLARPLLALWLCALMLFTGCGGGDNDATPTPPAPAPPPGQGTLVGSQPLATVPLADLQRAAASLADQGWTAAPRYAVQSWRLDYFTLDGRNRLVTASALVSVPVKPAGRPSPVLAYQHATSFYDDEAPTRRVRADEAPLLLASLGYIVLAPDYVGFGASRGAEHPYLLSTASAAVVVDLLTAAQGWRRTAGVLDNGQLFVAGYSEGAYVSMAALHALQAAGRPEAQAVELAVLGAGPYDVGLTLELQLARVRAENPALAALFNPNLLRDLGSTLRDEVRRLILRTLIPADATVGYQPTFLDNFLADDDAAVERDSNVHRWAPRRPLRLFHGRDDRTVPYAVSVQTLQTQQALGASDLSLTDCRATKADHIGCVPEYFAFVLTQFGSRARDL